MMETLYLQVQIYVD